MHTLCSKRCDFVWVWQLLTGSQISLLHNHLHCAACTPKVRKWPLFFNNSSFQKEKTKQVVLQHWFYYWTKKKSSLPRPYTCCSWISYLMEHRVKIIRKDTGRLPSPVWPVLLKSTRIFYLLLNNFLKFFLMVWFYVSPLFQPQCRVILVKTQNY